MNAIPPITPADPEAQSADPVAANIEVLQALFPDAFDDGKIDFDVFRQLLGDAVEDGDERYGLNWSGKRRARRLALTPSLGTLRPAPDDSIAWQATRNLMIEGDNLEVLKLLQKSYGGKVRFIYVDPPYNTGNDFVYSDDYADSLGNYLRRTGQVDAGGVKNTSNVEGGARFHTQWLSTLLPRMMLARGLLSDDGVVAVSINDREFHNLRHIMDSVFGEENFISSIIWKSRQNKDNRSVNGVSVDHEYIVCYGRKFRGDERKEGSYSNPDGDSRGDWTSANMVGLATIDRRPNLHYDLIDPATGLNYGCPPLGWRYDRGTMARLIEEKAILWPASADGRPRRKAFLKDVNSEFTGFSSVIGRDLYTRDGTSDISDLFEERIFEFPKPVQLLRELISQTTGPDDIVLDFFAGSGTSGHAVMAQNASDGGKRRYILVQLPEPLSATDPNQKTAADFCVKLGKPANIAELTKERLRRAAEKIRSSNPDASVDLGFRAYKLATSNLKTWSATEDLEADLLAAADNLVDGRTEDDLLVELLLKQGIDLTEPVVSKSLAGRTVHAFGGGVLAVCLGDVTASDAEAVADAMADWIVSLAPVAPTTVFFKDAGFENDQAKTNVAAVLEQRLGDQLLKVRSV